MIHDAVIVPPQWPNLVALTNVAGITHEIEPLCQGPESLDHRFTRVVVPLVFSWSVLTQRARDFWSDQPFPRRGGLRRHLLISDLELAQDGDCGLLDVLARRRDAGNCLFATTGPVCDVADAVIAAVDTKC